MQAAKRTPVDLKEWAVGLLERDNRKSHLAPQLSPATQALLRSTDSPVTATNPGNSPEYSLPTPTSGDIPIGGGDIRPANNTSSQQYHDSTRPSTNNGPTSAGRPSGAPFHPGLTPRAPSSNSIPKLPTPSNTEHTASNGSSGSTTPGFGSTTLPMRPAPAGPLPPPPVPRKEVGGEDKKDPRRQPQFSNNMYGYPTGGIH